MSAGVRRSDDADPAAIQHIYAHYVARTPASFEETPPEAAELARRRDAVIAGGLQHLVAERVGEIAGNASPLSVRIPRTDTPWRTRCTSRQAWSAGAGRRRRLRP